MYNAVGIRNPSNWQRPIWAVSTYLMFKGALDYSYRFKAHSTDQRFLDLLQQALRRNGLLYEYHHPETGLCTINPGFMNWNRFSAAMIGIRKANAHFLHPRRKQNCMKLFSECLGFLGIVLNVIIYQQKKRKNLLCWKLVSDISWALHYGVAGNFSGAAVGAIGIIRESTFLAIEGKKTDRRPFLAVFFLCACVSVWLTWKGWASLLPAVASMLSVISFWQRNPKLSRFLALPISGCMLSYDLLVGSYTGIANELLTLGSVFIGMYRHDLKGENV